MPESEGGSPRSSMERDALMKAIEHGPRGAFLVAGIATALLFLGWLAFYFFLFLPRGSIG
jgi:hypothetical protein